MNEVIVLDISCGPKDIEDIIHPVILKDEENMVLIDCGYTGSLPLLECAMKSKALFCKDLTHILITHQDHDHMGALSELKGKYPHVLIAAGCKESPYISGKIKFLRLEQAEAIQESLPEEQKPFGAAFCRMLKNVVPAGVDIEVQEGDVFDWCGGCSIVETPGHTPGHISIYLNEKNIMITGDAAVLENGRPVIANPQFAFDVREAERSLHKILSYGAEEIICYHGGIFLP